MQLYSRLLPGTANKLLRHKSFLMQTRSIDAKDTVLAEAELVPLSFQMMRLLLQFQLNLRILLTAPMSYKERTILYDGTRDQAKQQNS